MLMHWWDSLNFFFSFFTKIRLFNKCYDANRTYIRQFVNEFLKFYGLMGQSVCIFVCHFILFSFIKWQSCLFFSANRKSHLIYNENSPITESNHYFSTMENILPVYFFILFSLLAITRWTICFLLLQKSDSMLWRKMHSKTTTR